MKLKNSIMLYQRDTATLRKKRATSNKAFLTSIGVEYSIFEPTRTGLKKRILDATLQVRKHFKLEKFHDFEKQGQGAANKVYKAAHFVSGDIIEHTRVSLYRPMSKKGDPRMWFKGLPRVAASGDQIAVVIYKKALYLLNISRTDLAKLPANCKAADFIEQLNIGRNTVADELLKKLKSIARTPIKAAVKGDTAVGMALEQALGIKANSSKLPDYKGIELKAGRGKRNRTTLFGQVPDWSISPLKSSTEILVKYGYQRGDDFKLNCTLSTKKQNSQGLCLVYDERADRLIEKDGNGDVVAIWPGETLRKRLLEKHAETFWISARSKTIGGKEHFELLSVTHTRKPIVSQLMPLIGSGTITMDHLIKREKGTRTGKEKGPLFKLNKKDLKLIFPDPQTYRLKE